MIEGGCRCGACRYTLARSDLPPAYCCHCLDCQTWSGSAFAMQGVIRADTVASSGSVEEYAFTNPSGSISTQSLCGVCHTRLWNVNSAWAGMAVVRAGTLDASNRLVPRMHMWVKRKQPWVVIEDGVPSFAQAPTPGEFMTALTRPA